MTREELLAMAREAGFQTATVHMADGVGSYDNVRPFGGCCLNELERFAALVAAAEREACLDLLQNKQGRRFLDLGEVITAIRARGEVTK